MIARFGSLFRRPSPVPSVVATAAGFQLRGPSGTEMMVEWARVRRAMAYKRDLVTTDSIVLALELDPPCRVVEVSEEWAGFSELFAGMEAALGVSPAWYVEIMAPAFEPTPRLLYERPAADG